ncbi:unnamed protein product [Dracunculus medinensis]|uniref:BTB domain-containing protein n=1 Tax=Dracunculus medinensis TaxID=318479 RepID=A0A0N4UF47_DRAME|nr:unnamed protein product [Dracunculus medinensis]
MCDEDDDEVLLFECGASLAANAFSKFEEIRRSGKLCDVIIVASGVKFSAHRIVLAATIPYFRAMFTAEMAECQQNEICLKEMDADTLEQIIDFTYTGRLRITAANVQSTMEAANFLQLYSIVDECCKFLQCRLHSQNVLGIRSFAMTLGCVSLVLSADRFIHKHFLSVSQGEEYLMLKFDEISTILSRDELLVDNEQQIFEAAMRWLSYDPERSKYSAQILKTVRLPLLKPQYVTDEVASCPIINQSLECRDLVDEAKDYHLMPERRKFLKSFRIKQRCCQDAVGVIYAVGGLTSTGDSLSTVEMYNPAVGKWECTQAMNSIRSRVGVAVMNRILYAIGGFNGQERLRTVELFDPEKKQWKEVCPLINKRSALGAAVVNERLYVCGGYDGISSLSSVEVYDANTDKWTLTIPMNKQRSAAGIAVIDNFIYVIGGHDGMSIFNSVERFNVETEEWQSVKPMGNKRCRSGATALRDKIYVCGGYDGRQFLKSVEVYDPDKDEWSPLSPMHFKRSRVSLVANSGMLYAIAGYDGISNLSSVEIYNVEEDSWTLGSSMIAHEGGVGIGVIPIPAERL